MAESPAIGASRRTVLASLAGAVGLAFTSRVSAVAAPRRVAATTTLTVVAHPDDDLLFCAPHVISDVQAGYNTWVLYLTAGNVQPNDLNYADQRAHGVRAAYARMARVANSWHHEPMMLGGHEVATSVLQGTNVRLLFPYIHAASAPRVEDGDLHRLWHDPSFVAHPLDGRAPYTRGSLVAMLRALYEKTNPSYIRTQDTTASRAASHLDHICGALFAAEADTANGSTVRRRDEYYDYQAQHMAQNVSGYWETEKREAYQQYRGYDYLSAPWEPMMTRQHQRKVYQAGEAWKGRTDPI
ncbi:PIG-L family deacetylase [Longimycelium tulufanense]|uniref:PIG-L family deacetylase n=1 Tax=Longimycelium tulufanense TaxID=907463 RepID=UPI00166EF7D2|nr:PIG-L family deacetylase [Longimycelium tulufanense]